MKIVSALVVIALAGASAAVANAELIVGLTTSGQLQRFDSASPGAIIGTSPVISGLNGGDSIVDIDFYPVSGLLHGMGTSGTLYRIDPISGVAVVDVTPQSSLGTPTDVDFNPSADRLRVFSVGDANFRITSSTNTAGPTGVNAGLVTSDGTLTFASGANPNLVGNAYTNNFDGTATTTLYSIDTDLDSLIIHSGTPQFSTLAIVGGLGQNVGSLVGFDISPLGNNYVSNGNALFSINLATGLLSSIGTIGGSNNPLTVSTIAVNVPGPGAACVAGLGAVALGRRRR